MKVNIQIAGKTSSCLGSTQCVHVCVCMCVCIKLLMQMGLDASVSLV